MSDTKEIAFTVIGKQVIVGLPFESIERVYKKKGSIVFDISMVKEMMEQVINSSEGKEVTELVITTSENLMARLNKSDPGDDLETAAGALLFDFFTDDKKDEA